MYSAVIDGKLLYSPDLADDGYVISDPEMTKEVNKAGSFEFSMTTLNPLYNDIHELKSLVTIMEDNRTIWRGRVLHTEYDFTNNKKVYCEGCYSYFVDSTTRPYKYKKKMEDHFKTLIENHNSQVDEFKKFEIGTIDVEDLYGERDWEQTDYVQTQEQLDSLIDDYGGYIVISWDDAGKNIISYVKNPSRYSSQSIRFGENLLDFTNEVNPENVITVLIPIGYDANSNLIDIKSVNDGKDYLVSETGVQRYGQIVRAYVFENNVTSPSDLKTKGQAYLDANINTARTITIKAVDLHIINPEIERFEVGDLIKVTSDVHGIDTYEMCTKITINLQHPEDSEFVIGEVPAGIVSK